MRVKGLQAIQAMQKLTVMVIWEGAQVEQLVP